ncbi:MAG: hypothetical protein IPF72_17285 [Chitinophagaceae bacterium]|nr:hypothetical protein [Chitinophagaceae bacterium]
MTKKLILIFLFASQISFAQNKPQPTQFDKFVNKPGIEWAAYASDTVNFTSAGLNNLLLKRISKSEIKASKPVESRTAETDKITYCPLDSIDQAFYGDRIDILMDSTGTQYFMKRDVPEKDSSNFKGTEVTQILYIEKGKLKSYIPFITPTLPVNISSGKYIGERFYFTSCFNYTYNSKPRNKSKLIFLTQTKKMISLTTTQNDQLKEMYGQNLLESIWPYVLKNEIDVFAVEDNRKLKQEELKSNLLFSDAKIIPIYDSISIATVKKFLVIYDPIDPSRFTNVQLVQDWYYDHKRNKIYSNIKEMILFIKRDDKEKAPVLRLVFR